MPMPQLICRPWRASVLAVPTGAAWELAAMKMHVRSLRTFSGFPWTHQGQRQWVFLEEKPIRPLWIRSAVIRKML